LKLKWRDIDLVNGYIHIEKVKGGKIRDIIINYGFDKRLLEYGIKLANSEHVFCNDNGKPFRNINRP
jgi:integrase